VNAKICFLRRTRPRTPVPVHLIPVFRIRALSPYRPEFAITGEQLAESKSAMSLTLNPLAPEHPPFFVTGPGQTDGLMIAVLIILLSAILLVGVFYFTLHALPEKMAHGADPIKMQLVGILCLLALFTHNNAFWIIALLVAAVRLPDFLSPIKSLSRSVKTLTVLLRESTDLQTTPSKPESEEV
jgi:hypothetical protein